MDPTTKYTPRYNKPLDTEKSADISPKENKDSLEQIRSPLKNEVQTMAGDNSMMKINEPRSAKSLRPPPPKTPPPPVPSGVQAGIISSTNTPPSELSTPPEKIKPPSSMTTADTTETEATTRNETATTTTSPVKKPSPLVDTTTYPADYQFVSAEDAEKKPLRTAPEFAGLHSASMRVRFDARTQADFFMSLGTEAKQLVETYQLSFSEAAAIVAYTNDSFFKAINHQFRSLKLDRIDITNPDFLINAGVENRDLAEVIAALVSGMRKLPPVQVDDSNFMALGRNVTMKKHELDLYKQDAEIVSPTFLSTTYSANAMISEKVGFWNAKDNAMFIYQRVNGNARDISAFSVYPGEKEILFLPNTKFKVLFRSEPEKTSRGADANELAEIEKKYHFEDKKTTFLSQIQDFVEQLINVAKPTAPVTKADDSLTKSFIVLQEIPYDSDPTSSS